MVIGIVPVKLKKQGKYFENISMRHGLENNVNGEDGVSEKVTKTMRFDDFTPL